jgi:hypothetical protein
VSDGDATRRGLVDVRGAQIDAAQRAWFERCGAILDRQAGA